MKNLTRTTLISLVTVTALSLGAWATCSDDVDMGEHNIINVADPVNPQDVATMAYVQTYVNTVLEQPQDRFSRNDDKMIVADRNTGLMWQDNADVADDSKKKPWLTQDDYDECEADTSSDICKNIPPKTGTAQKYCYDLTLGGYSDWRLPTKDELKGIVKSDVGSPTISGVFQNTVSNLYWSSSSHEDKRVAWVVYFTKGGMDGYAKVNNLYVRCVRDGQ